MEPKIPKLQLECHVKYNKTNYLILIINSTDYFIDIRFLALSEMKEKYNFKFPFTTYYGLLTKSHTNWMEKGGITCHNKWAWWVSKLRNNFEAFFHKRYANSSILDKSFSTPIPECRIFIDHGFTKEKIPDIYMPRFKILGTTKLIMF